MPFNFFNLTAFLIDPGPDDIDTFAIKRKLLITIGASSRVFLGASFSQPVSVAVAVRESSYTSKCHMPPH